MKKSEIRQIIKEEILKEIKVIHGSKGEGMVQRIVGKTLLDTTNGDKYKVTQVVYIEETPPPQHSPWVELGIIIYDASTDDRGRESEIQLEVKSIKDLLLGKTVKKYGLDTFVGAGILKLNH